tara:strand:- start:3548 stop:3760 length:213 start_codon:yes stop_codon:yes gene_type:complete
VSEEEAIKIVKEFVRKWSDFSVAFTASPGPLYTAGCNAVADVIRREAQELLPAIESLASTSSAAWGETDA